MLLPRSEMLRDGEAIDAMSARQAASSFLQSQHGAIDAIEAVAAEIDAGADAMAAAIRGDHSLIYAAAGSSGLMALADASELTGTFGIPNENIQIHMAGGVPVDARMPGNTEDDTAEAERAGRSAKAGDVALVLSVSGTTPYALSVAKTANANGATVIGIANHPDTELLAQSHIAICIQTPPEVIAGSTRLGGGTAQKVVLNLMSSLMGVKLGHVYCGRMVNVIADNAKLTTRAAGIVTDIAGVSETDAREALAQSGGNAKTAILVASGCTPSQARDLLNTHDGHLAPCFETLNRNQNDTTN